MHATNVTTVRQAGCLLKQGICASVAKSDLFQVRDPTQVQTVAYLLLASLLLSRQGRVGQLAACPLQFLQRQCRAGF
jgi:hypothetical protein